MQAAELAEATAIILGFHAAFLVIEKESSEQKAVAPIVGREVAEKLWETLHSSGKAQPSLDEALLAVANAPSEDLMITLRHELEIIFDSAPAVAGGVEEVIAQGSYASLVGKTAPVSLRTAYTIRGKSISFIQMNHDRKMFGTLYIVTAILLMGLFALFGAILPIPIALIVAGMVIGGIAWHFAKRLGITKPGWLWFASIIPGGFFPVLFTIRGYIPPPSGPLEPWVKKWVTGFALLPLLLLVVMLIFYPTYTASIFNHVVGFLMVVAWFTLYAVAWVGLINWYWKGRGKTGLQFGILSALLGATVMAGLWLVWFGPAAVRTFIIALNNYP